MKNATLAFEAPSKIWTDALPIGNGRLGAMVYGRIGEEKIQLNEETLWSGWYDPDADNPECAEHLDEIRKLVFEGRLSEAEELANRYFVCRGAGGGSGKVPAKDLPYGSYQTAGDLFIKLHDDEETSSYTRSLDLSSGIATVIYKTHGQKFTREYFASEKYSCVCGRIYSPLPFKADYRFRRDDAVIEESEDLIKAHGSFPNGISYGAAVRIVRYENENLIYISVRTNYAMDGKLDIDPLEEAVKLVNAAADEDYEYIKCESAARVYDLMSRSTLDLAPDIRVNTDKIKAYISKYDAESKLEPVPGETFEERGKREGDVAAVNGVIELFYNYGRYLMIASSRNCVLPANLQGIWTNDYNTIWSADYHININIQMNYWLTELTGLPECGDIFMRYIKFLSEHGKRTAKVNYGMNGWVAHTITNPWGFTAPGNGFSWGSFMCAGAWCCEHIWQRWLFTENIDFLREYYPVMKGSCEFFLDFLTEDPETGYLVTVPSNSPENHYRDPGTGKTVAICAGPTMDNSILYELFTNTIAAAKLLETDEEFSEKLKKTRDRLPPIKIGKYGQIMEWQKEFEETEPGHRHLSMLYGLYPSDLITRSKTPELFEAAKVSIARRLSAGGGHTGWSKAWIINFFARLGMGREAYNNLFELITKSTYANLFDAHPPFQIDGNFGAVAGIVEMLVQSHEGYVELLPALPPTWRNGGIYGICARGGLLVAAEWEDGKLARFEVESEYGGDCEIRYGDKSWKYTFLPGGSTAEVV